MEKHGISIYCARVLSNGIPNVYKIINESLTRIKIPPSKEEVENKVSSWTDSPRSDLFQSLDGRTAAARRPKEI